MRSLERKLAWSFAAVLVLLAANGIVSFWSLTDLASDTILVVRSRTILNQLAEIDASIKDAETARRGILIDDNLQDHAAFELATQTVLDGVGRLVTLNKERPIELARCQALEQVARQRLGEFRETIARMQIKGVRSAQATFGLEPIRRHLADFRALVEKIEVDESRDLTAREDKRREGIRRAFVTFTVASLLALVLIGLLDQIVRRSFASRRRAELAIQSSEARVRLLLDSVGEGIYGIDTLGRCTFCNNSALRLLGYDAVEQVLGRDMHQLIHHTHPDGTPFPKQDCPVYQTFRTGVGVSSTEDIFHRADGKAIPVEYRAQAIRRGGEVLGAVVTFVDIAPKRRSETETRRRDRALRAIAQGVFIADGQREGAPILYANAALARMTGLDDREIWGRGFVELLQGEGGEGDETRKLREAIRDSREASVELASPRGDGSTSWKSISIAPVHDPHAGPGHFVGVVTDITERRENEQKLRISENRLRMTLESVQGYAIFSIDLDGLISNWNAGAQRLLGYREEEIVGRATSMLSRSRTGEAVDGRDELAEARALGRFEREEWQVRADGSGFLSHGIVTPVREDRGALVGYTKILRDITESKRIEATLRAAKDASDAANRAKSTFLANMSHELRTPLNAIIGYSEMLAEEAREMGIESFTADLKRINLSGWNLLDLINNVLEVSKIEAGRTEIASTSYQFADLIRDVVQGVEKAAEEHGNVVQVDYPADLKNMRGDYNKIRQCLMNLTSNAAKFTENGRIMIRAARHRDASGFAWIHFLISDDGIGMSQREVAQLFEPFVQADGSTGRRYGGSGLGLTITRRYCRLMGGDVEVVESEPGRGSTFLMKIPEVQECRPGEPRPSSGDADSSRPPASRAVSVEVDPPQPSVHQLAGEGRVTCHVFDEDATMADWYARQLQPSAAAVSSSGISFSEVDRALGLAPRYAVADASGPNLLRWGDLHRLILGHDSAERSMRVMLVDFDAADEDFEGWIVLGRRLLSEKFPPGSKFHAMVMTEKADFFELAREMLLPWAHHIVRTMPGESSKAIEGHGIVIVDGRDDRWSTALLGLDESTCTIIIDAGEASLEVWPVSANRYALPTSAVSLASLELMLRTATINGKDGSSDPSDHS